MQIILKQVRGMRMGIYKLKKDDVKQAIAVSQKFHCLPSTEDKVAEFLSNDKNHLIVYYLDSEMVGFVLGYELQRFDVKDNMMYLHEIDVLPEHRKKGIGKALMHALMDVCKKGDVYKMFLLTERSNSPAVALYEATNGKAINDDDIMFEFEL